MDLRRGAHHNDPDADVRSRRFVVIGAWEKSRVFDRAGGFGSAGSMPAFDQQTQATTGGPR